MSSSEFNIAPYDHSTLPRKNQIWEAITAGDAHIQYLFTAPITLSGSIKLAAGEQICITTETTSPQPADVSFRPVHYKELHDTLVSRDIRETPRYKEYLLSVKADCFHEHFRLVKDLT